MPYGNHSTHPTTTGNATLERPGWLGPDVWPFAIRTFHHAGRRIHYIDEGTGPTIVFVHAGMWSFVWRDLIRELSTSFRCLALDFPGAGLSDGSAREIDLEAFTTLTVDWLDHLDVDRAVIAVHDLGGVVGVNAAARRPDEIEGLVAINAFAWPPAQRSLRTMLRLMGSRGVTASLGTVRLIPRMTRGKFGVGRHLERPDRRAFYGPYRTSRAKARNFHRVMRSAAHTPTVFESADDALRATLRDLPVMTVFGEKNDPFDFADTWHERFPTATSHVIDGGNHFPMCDAPNDLARWIRTWYRASVGTSQSGSAA